MTFAEKLDRLIDGRERVEIARLVDVAPTVLSNYLNRKTMPRVDIALRLSKVFRCSLAWLVDETRGWETPDRSVAADLGTLYVRAASRVRNDIDAAAKIDWVRVAKAIHKISPDAPIPSEIANELRLAESLRLSRFSLLRFDVCRNPYSSTPAKDRPSHGGDLQIERLIGDLENSIKNLRGLLAVKLAMDIRAMVTTESPYPVSDAYRTNLNGMIDEARESLRREMLKLDPPVRKTKSRNLKP